MFKLPIEIRKVGQSVITIVITARFLFLIF